MTADITNPADPCWIARAPGFADGGAIDPARSDYQRDLGRVIHSSSFRRLQAKTQVLGTGEGDFHRTRLTHSLEVGQIGRGIVWHLQAQGSAQADATNANWLPPTELMEAICYCHDMGHPPFGHGGEATLHGCMVDHGGFEGNAQTVRIMTRLEKYHQYQGIQPTRRLLLGVLKYPAPMHAFAKDSGKPPKCYYSEDSDIIAGALNIFSPADIKTFTEIDPAKNKTRHKTFDCSIMELADDIAYGVHDMEDGLARNILKRDEVRPLLAACLQDDGITHMRDVPAAEVLDMLLGNDSCARKHAISLVVGYLITSIQVRAQGIFIAPLLDLQAYLPDAPRQLLDVLQHKITGDMIIRLRNVRILRFKGVKIIQDLFTALASDPLGLVGSALDTARAGVHQKLKDAGPNWKTGPDANIFYRAIADYIAGMTDPYAEKFHRRLFEPGYGSSTDEI